MLNFIKKYKRIFWLLVFYTTTAAITMYLYKHGSIDQEQIKDFISSIGIFGFIVLGILYSQGITGPIAATIFTLYTGSTPSWLIALMGGIGTALVDLFMYEIFRYEIKDELNSMKKSSFIKRLSRLPIFKDKLLMTFVGFLIIASPLSDDFGTILIEEEGVIKTKYFFIIDMLLNMAGIYFFLSI